jgi:hypothetical protein
VEALLAFLQARGLAVTHEQRGRIEACTDLATLDAWIRRAATIAKASELLSP